MARSIFGSNIKWIFRAFNQSKRLNTLVELVPKG